jgi:elongation factor G
MHQAPMSDGALMNAIISDLNARRGEIQGRRVNGNIVTITAAAPLANMSGYAGNLSRISQRRASFTMQFGEYRAIPLHDDDPTFPPAVGMRT